MSALITAQSLSKSFGTQELFNDVSFTVASRDRIGLIGPNGAGKSSLIKILAGLDAPDTGNLIKAQGLKIGYASQAPEFPSQTIEEFLSHGDGIKARVLLGKAEIEDLTQIASELSGGWKKRLDIVRAMTLEPDLLLLDEPTNHLDLEGILWLEDFLQKLTIPYVVISHDRVFLEKVTNRIFELNRCYPDGLLQTDGNMSEYTRQKQEYLNLLENKRRELSFKVRKEVDWLRTSPKARTTKSEARVQEAYRLIDELSDVKQRKKVRTVGLDFSSSDRQTRKLIQANNVQKTLGGKQLFKGLDLTLGPNSRLGIVGKNGTGKTTLLKVLAGQIPQDMGTIKYADDLKIVYFDQHRTKIPSDATLKEALSPSSDMVDYRGQKIHVNGWAKRFLFEPERLNLPVRCLSGGERARILIAKLMCEDADVLFLDEPTNDLDIPTLEVIEESLSTFSGSVVMISHDRCLMERICTKILALEENAGHAFFADYKQWEQTRNKEPAKQKLEKKQTKTALAKPSSKLIYKEKLELEGMEEKILQKEMEIRELNKKIEEETNTAELYNDLANSTKALEELYERWQYLLDRSN